LGWLPCSNNEGTSTAEPAGTTGRARAARSRGSRPGSGTRGGLNVTVQDLTEEAACHALYQKAHALGLVHERRGDGVLVPRPRSVACEQAFFTLARYCVRAPRVKDACALFVAKLRRAEWAGDESDQAWALERLRVLHGSPLDGVAESLASRPALASAGRSVPGETREPDSPLDALSSSALRVRAERGDEAAAALLVERSAASSSARAEVERLARPAPPAEVVGNA